MTGINVVAELENNYAQQVMDYQKELKAVKGDSPEGVALTAKIKKTEQQQNKLMAIIDKVKETETNPRLKQILGIK